MKKPNQTFFILLVSVYVIFAFSSCATNTMFLNSKIAPAAQGIVKVKQNKSKNYEIHVKLANLAPSTRLTPPAKTYVMWIVTENNDYYNLGQFNTSKKFMSKKLNTNIYATTGFKPYKVLITAENEASVTYPSFGEPILITDYLK
jgi:hypothetical protein